MAAIMNDTIEDVKNAHLCTGCGTCAGICPYDAVRMGKDIEGIYVPIIEGPECRNCRLCFDVCPGHSVNFSEVSKSFLSEASYDALLGNYINCYLGYSSDKELRWVSSSGGLATTLSTFMLEKRIVNGVIVTRLNSTRPLNPEVIIARSKAEIISASGSKYCPVPVNTRIKDVLRESGKFAFVGLPCHIHGLRKAQMLNPELKEKIVFQIGLFCSHNSSFAGTEFLLKKINVMKRDVVKLTYRGTGWPGGMSIGLKDGTEKFIPYHKYYPLVGSFFFTPRCCLLCADATNELADISIGDAWLPEFKSSRKGISVTITRSEIGQSVLKRASSDGKVIIVKTSMRNAIRSQKSNLDFKKRKLWTRLLVWKFFGKNVRDFNSHIDFPKPAITFFPSALLCYMITCVLCKSSLLRRLLLFIYSVFVEFSFLIRRIFFSRFDNTVPTYS